MHRVGEQRPEEKLLLRNEERRNEEDEVMSTATTFSPGVRVISDN
jgi:hypothetical protein